MKQLIIKETGNSRTLKSVANFLTLYPTYEAFAQALITGTLPVDIGGINPAGVQQEGDPLNKATLLKDSTAALYGLGSGAVPDEVLANLASRISALDNKIKIVNGTFVGDFRNGKTINTGFSPKLFFIVQSANYISGSSEELRFYLAVNPYIFWAGQNYSSGRTNISIYGMNGSAWITSTGINVPSGYLYNVSYSYLVIG